MICGKEIDINDDTLLGFMCKDCSKNAGVMPECLWCEHLNLFKSPPCSLDFVIIENEKCTFYYPSVSSDDLIKKSRLEN